MANNDKQVEDPQNSMKGDGYAFFDLIKVLRETFIRMTEIRVYYVNEPVRISKKLYAKVKGSLPQ